MPKLMGVDASQTYKTVHQFQFSAVDIEKLGAWEYTVVTVVQDTSTSVTAFKKDMEECLKKIVDACKKSPRSENLLLRVITFNNNSTELHGFTELRNIDVATYDDCLRCMGMTALYDAVVDGVESTEAFGKALVGKDRRCNAVMFIITDGEENASHIIHDVTVIKDTIAKVRRSENLESVMVVLVGVGDDPSVKQYFVNFKDQAGLDQLVELGEATPGKLAKLADFVSKSISSVSKSLQNGQASQPLTF